MSNLEQLEQIEEQIEELRKAFFAGTLKASEFGEKVRILRKREIKFSSTLVKEVSERAMLEAAAHLM